MKVLIFIIIFFSFVMGIPTNLGWITLFTTEFIDPLYMIINSGHFTIIHLILWVILWLIHIALVGLFFFVNHKYFKQFLIWIPLIFITVFTIYATLIIFLLTPFILFWVIALLKAWYKPKQNISF
jgi:hypothetical protein